MFYLFLNQSDTSFIYKLFFYFMKICGITESTSTIYGELYLNISQLTKFAKYELSSALNRLNEFSTLHEIDILQVTKC